MTYRGIIGSAVATLVIGATIVGISIMSEGSLTLTSLTKHLFSQPSPQPNAPSSPSPAPSIEHLLQLSDFVKKVETPSPLRILTSSKPVSLDETAIFQETNRQRAQNGAAALTRNSKLNEAAAKKVQDMFDQQYFEHEAPDGTGPGELITSTGYSYIRVGENLALGNFSSDADLLQAWMNSPGHRANIVSKGFTEIGVAAAQGEFEGSPVGLAVQEFGTPLSACDAPSDTLKQSIDDKLFTIKTLQTTLMSLDAQIQDQEVATENLSVDAQSLADQSNRQVKAGNEKIEQGNQVYADTGSKEQAQPYWDEGTALQQKGADLLKQAQEKQSKAGQAQTTLANLQNEYNADVSTINTSSAAVQQQIDSYNTQVKTFNACIETYQE